MPGDNCGPHNFIFPDLVSWLKTQLGKIRDTCSLLFLSLSGHGFLEHIVDSKKVGFKIEDLLEIIEKAFEEEKRNIPKVCRPTQSDLHSGSTKILSS